ncbi:MAG: tetratricopeptide repeat protein [Planctomycetota bacterium]
MNRIAAALGLVLSITMLGCQASTSPYAPGDVSARNPQRAAELTTKAAEAIDAGELDKAEKVLREALAEDLFYGPAHNNLGVIFLKQAKLYSAAGEFEWARKLMPGQPDPRINLAITLEKAGQIGDAQDAYRAALEASPLHVDAMTGLARLQIVAGNADHETFSLLNRIESSSDDPGLRAWARDQRLRLAHAPAMR